MFKTLKDFQNVIFFYSHNFFKLNFLHDEKIFFDGNFFEVILLLWENRFKAVLECFRDF